MSIKRDSSRGVQVNKTYLKMLQVVRLFPNIANISTTTFSIILLTDKN